MNNLTWVLLVIIAFLIAYIFIEREETKSYKKAFKEERERSIKRFNQLIDLQEEVNEYRNRVEMYKQTTAGQLHSNDPLPNNNVNHPSHYQGDIETIDYIKDKLTPEEFRGFCKANGLKYISRERLKNGDEDLKKARWYLNKLLEVEE